MANLFSFDEVPQQPRARWFVSRGQTVDLNRGFSSKQAASEWIESLGRRVDWRVGYTFRFRADNVDMKIVDAGGNLAKVK